MACGIGRVRAWLTRRANGDDNKADRSEGRGGAPQGNTVPAQASLFTLTFFSPIYVFISLVSSPAYISSFPTVIPFARAASPPAGSHQVAQDTPAQYHNEHVDLQNLQGKTCSAKSMLKTPAPRETHLTCPASRAWIERRGHSKKNPAKTFAPRPSCCSSPSCHHVLELFPPLFTQLPARPRRRAPMPAPTTWMNAA